MKGEHTVKKIIIEASVALLVIACAQKPIAPQRAEDPKTPAASTPAPSLPPGHPAVPEPGAKQQAKGVVLESMDAAGFTYMKLRTEQGEVWIVTPTASVKKGVTIVYMPNLTTEKFESKTLHRKFDRVTFASIVSGAETATPPMMSSMPSTGTTDPHGSIARNTAAPETIHVDKAAGEDAKTVAEIWAAKSSLTDASVVVRGRVVKFLPGIMGKNWIHLRDGTGSREKGDDDLTVTTADRVAVGDVVVVSGVVHVDKDFGAGYRYPVIVENARVTK